MHIELLLGIFAVLLCVLLVHISQRNVHAGPDVNDDETLPPRVQQVVQLQMQSLLSSTKMDGLIDKVRSATL